MPSPSGTRSPLENTTNGGSPPGATAKTGPILRRKASNRALHPQLDSSESYPSPHSSIYEASLVDSSTEHVNWYDASDWTNPSAPEQGASLWPNNGPASWENTVVDSSGNAVPASFLQETPSPKKHTPHKLYPITEQNSLATLRPGPSISTLKGHPSASTMRPLSPGLNGKKQKSFSTSDVPPVPKDTTPSPPPSPQEFYTPVEPQRPPPTRMSTPPSLPKFNTPAASTYRLPPPTVRFRDKFRSPTPAEQEWTMQTVALPRGVVMRGEGGVLVRGKFTPIRSGHFPPQRQQHAIFRVDNAGGNGAAVGGSSQPRPVVVDRRVRFTGPRMEGPMPAAADAMQSEKKRKKGGRSERVMKKFYWFVGCCGICEKWEASAERGRGSQRGFDGSIADVETPLFVGGFHAMG